MSGEWLAYESSWGCGCRAWIADDKVHVRPCSRAHAKDKWLARRAGEAALANGRVVGHPWPDWKVERARAKAGLPPLRQ